MWGEKQRKINDLQARYEKALEERDEARVERDDARANRARIDNLYRDLLTTLEHPRMGRLLLAWRSARRRAIDEQAAHAKTRDNFSAYAEDVREGQAELRRLRRDTPDLVPADDAGRARALEARVAELQAANESYTRAAYDQAAATPNRQGWFGAGA